MWYECYIAVTNIFIWVIFVLSHLYSLMYCSITCLKDILPGIIFCMYICMPVWIDGCTYTYMQRYIHLYLYMYRIYLYLHMKVYMHVCLCSNINISIYDCRQSGYYMYVYNMHYLSYTYSCISAYIHPYKQKYIYICIYMSAYIYTYRLMDVCWHTCI